MFFIDFATFPAGCPLSRLHIVSYNETLLPRLPDNIRPQIQFSSGPLVGTSFINYGPNHTNVWCAPEIETFPEPLVNLLFTEPVVVVGIISGGYTYETSDILDGMKEYVSSFTLQYAESQDDNFTLYNADLTGNGETVSKNMIAVFMPMCTWLCSSCMELAL